MFKKGRMVHYAYGSGDEQKCLTSRQGVDLVHKVPVNVKVMENFRRMMHCHGSTVLMSLLALKKP